MKGVLFRYCEFQWPPLLYMLLAGS